MKKLLALLLCLAMVIVSAPAVFATEEDEDITLTEEYVDDGPNAGRYTYTTEGLVYDTWNDYLYEPDEGYTTEDIDAYIFTNDGEFSGYIYNGTTEIVEEEVAEESTQVSSENQVRDEDPIETGESDITDDGSEVSENPTTSDELLIALGLVAALAVACLAKRKVSA
ncbi:MAG: hypothetical protein LUC38_08535 [Oscillospiraceae bacterium]|nr:hypothetical protein [Oscillospiraceae bacterium]